MLKSMKRLIRILISFSFILFCLLEAINLNCFQMSFYNREYKELNVAEDVGCSFEELMIATDVLLDYTRGKREDMSVTAVIDGVNREVFNEREKAHMVDVSALYQNAMKVRTFCFFLIIAGIVWLLVKKELFLFSLSQTYNRCSLGFLLGFGALCFYALSDFDTFWTNFHHVFFTKNDFWLLNPRTDLLIRMVPEKFFFDLVFRIVISFLSVYLISNLAAYIYQRKKVNSHA